MADYLTEKDWKGQLKLHKEVKDTGISEPLREYEKNREKDFAKAITALKKLTIKVEAAKKDYKKNADLCKYLRSMASEAQDEQETLEKKLKGEDVEEGPDKELNKALKRAKTDEMFFAVIVKKRNRGQTFDGSHQDSWQRNCRCKEGTRRRARTARAVHWRRRHACFLLPRQPAGDDATVVEVAGQARRRSDDPRRVSRQGGSSRRGSEDKKADTGNPPGSTLAARRRSRPPPNVRASMRRSLSPPTTVRASIRHKSKPAKRRMSNGRRPKPRPTRRCGPDARHFGIPKINWRFRSPRASVACSENSPILAAPLVRMIRAGKDGQAKALEDAATETRNVISACVAYLSKSPLVADVEENPFVKVELKKSFAKVLAETTKTCKL